MKTCFWVSASIAALLSAGTAQAQTADSATDSTEAAKPADKSGEIVVTAERRSTSLQKAGVAATVLTGEDLANKSVNTVDQLQFSTPSLTVNNGGQGNQFNIRGIGKGETGSTIGVGVITYRDGVAVFPGYFQNEPYFDIASVEVLRGPQGTFAGGNATGGAVFVTEKNPDVHSVNGYALAQYGNYNDIKVQGALNVPLSDTLAIRVAGNVEMRDTFFKVSGPYTGNPGNLRSYSARASLLWQPDAHWRLLIKGDYSNVNLGGYPGGPQLATGDPFVVALNAYLNGRDESGRIVGNLSYTTDGGVQFRSITGYQHGTSVESIDSDGTATTASTFKDRGDETVWSQEFNIVSPDKGPFTWLLGAYWQDDKLVFPPGSFLTHSAAFDINLQGANPKSALAAFGQVGYELTDGLQVTLGARWSRTTSSNHALITIPQFALTRTQDAFNSSKKLNGKIAINWTVDPDNFLYAFVATGSKAGGINAPNLLGVTPVTFAPEDVTDYEIGWKSTWADGHVRTQLGGYYNQYKGYQVLIVDPTTPGFNSILNVNDKSELYGAEFSAQGSFGAFHIDFATSVSHSSIGSFFAFDPRLGHTGACNPQTGPATATGCIDLTGRSAVYAPDFTLSAGAQYAIPLGGDVTLTPRVDYSHTAPVWATLFQNTALRDQLVARDLFNAQLTLDAGSWSLTAFSTNLTDRRDVVSYNNSHRNPAAPRQYGLRAKLDF
jgi:iron complex outermembrane receptor protein